MLNYLVDLVAALRRWIKWATSEFPLTTTSNKFSSILFMLPSVVGTEREVLGIENGTANVRMGGVDEEVSGTHDFERL